MPAPKTPRPELPEDDSALDAAAPGNVADPTVLLNDLAATQELVLKQEEMIQRLAAQVEKLSQTAASDEPAAVVEAGPPPLREGYRRYASRLSELTLVKVAGRRIYINGEPIFEPHVHVDFTGGVYETNDEALQEWIEAHDAFGVDFWLDEYAIRRHSTVEVQEGPRSSDVTPRVPRQALVAPME